MDGNGFNQNENWVCVYRSPDPLLIEILARALAEAGIDQRLSDKRDSNYIFIGDIELYVEDWRLEQALDIIKQHNL
ncbi:MAG: DUF2007 domain-containing protein [Bacteroidota bacterium]|jgi:hypothetical protein